MFICEICHKSFVEKRSLRKHKERDVCVRPAHLFKCKLCEKVCECKRSLRWHTKMYHGFRFRPKCEKCDKIFISDFHLKQHLNVCGVKLEFNCKLCNKHFAAKNTLNRHIEKMSCIKPQCEGCKTEFRDESHKSKHKCDVKPEICPVCSKLFSTISSFKVHFASHADEKTFPCCICENFFKRNSELKAHMRIHTGEKPYKCKECDASFRQASALKDHLATHNDIRPFHCSCCDKAFKLKATLKKHFQIHEGGETNNKCDKCDKIFLTSSTLWQHKQTHNKEKLYICPECGKCFKLIPYLKLHVKIFHPKGSKFSCSVCSQSFGCEKYLLNKHMRAHSNEKGSQQTNENNTDITEDGIEDIQKEKE